MKSKARIALIGCGGFMQWYHLPQLLKDRRVQLTAVADPDPAQIASLLGKVGRPLPSYADYREMIRREKLDAVFICTPHSLHYEQARTALLSGLHVLVQKPFTIRSDHALKLTTLAEKQSRYLMVAYQRFHHGQAMYARELIAKGHIGDIRGVACYITQDWDTRALGWRKDPALAGGGFMMDTGSHLVSSMLDITGLKPVEVTATTENYGEKVDLSSVVSIRFNNGALGSLNFFGTTKLHDECMSIHGTKGSIVLRAHMWNPKPLLVNDEPITIPARVKSSTPDTTFINWICNGGKGYAPPRIAIDTIKLTEAAYRSAAGKKAVKIRL
jgi:predicted dehydrogenase